MARRLYNQLIPLWSNARGPFGPRGGPWGGPWGGPRGGPGGGFGSPFRNIEQQLLAMEKHMNDMFQEFGQIPPLDHESEQEVFENPIVTDKDGKKKMQLHFDIRHFKPEEVSIKTENNLLTVHAKHKSKSENSAILREYQRQFTLPEGVEAERMTSELTPDGILTIEAPLPSSEVQNEEPKSIPIEHIKDKENK